MKKLNKISKSIDSYYYYNKKGKLIIVNKHPRTYYTNNKQSKLEKSPDVTYYITPSKKDIEKLSIVFARAFKDYPLFNYELSDMPEHERIEKLQILHKVLLNYAFDYGKVYADSNLNSVLITTDKDISNFGMFLNGAINIPLKLGSEFMDKNDPIEKLLNKMHKDIMKDKKHTYLWAIAVDPDFQGRGLAKGMFNIAISESKRSRLPIYLETNDPKNVDIYKHLGFKLRDTMELKDIGLKTFGMTYYP